MAEALCLTAGLLMLGSVFGHWRWGRHFEAFDGEGADPPLASALLAVTALFTAGLAFLAAARV